MNCRRVRQLLSEDQEGGLTGRDAGEFAVHLRACAACSRLREALAVFESKVRETAQWQPAVRRDLPSRAVACWLAERAMQVPPRRSAVALAFHPVAWRPLRWVAAATAMLLIIAGLILARWDVARP